MKRSSCRFCLLLLIGLSVTAGLELHSGAQSPVGPAVTVVRNPALSGELWPSDFDEDGFADLAGTDHIAGFGQIVHVATARGRGDGTFEPPVVTAIVGRAVGAADMNGDRHRDVLALDLSDAESPRLVILPGNGDGTFDPPRTVAVAKGFTFALTHDLTGDGHRDLVIASEDSFVEVYPGNGDFTFGAPTPLFTGLWPHGGIIADLNDDGRRDLVVANRYSASLTIAINTGGMNFTLTDIPLGRAGLDVTVGDADGDGHIDLFAAAAASGFFIDFTDGFAYVLKGNGDGTFAPPAMYPVARGASQVVVGDFTGDGRLDIATGNQSIFFIDDCTTSVRGWDSVSILAGTGGGTFDAAWTFSLGDQRDHADDRYRGTIASLATNDLNRDGRTDIIASHGALLFTGAPAPNRPPQVDAGLDRLIHDSDGQVVLDAAAFDPDDHLLEFRWQSDTGHGANWPHPCLAGLGDGLHTFRVTIDDGLGGIASDDVVFTVVRTGTALPSVALSAPADGTAYTAPATVELSATAEDTDGKILKVDFYANRLHIGSDATAPYSVRWEDVPQGTYELHAVATDDFGGTSVSNMATVTVGLRGEDVFLADDFDDGSLDPGKWVVANLFSGSEDASVPVTEASGHLEIGPLLQASGSHYNGIASVRAFNFAGRAASVRLDQGPAAAGTAQAFFAVGVNSSNYYRLYVSAGILYAERRINGVKASIRTVPYDPLTQMIWRIRHEAATQRVVFETASDSNGDPGRFTFVAADTWNTSAVPIASVRFELKAGTSVEETVPAGTVAFDDFVATALPPRVTDLIADTFDGSLDLTKWSKAVVSGLQDSSIAVDGAGGLLTIGPLKTNAAGSHYNGIVSRQAFDLTGAAATVQLAQWPFTPVFGMWTLPIDGSNHYRTYLDGVAPGIVLRFEEKIDGVKREIAAVPYIPAAHSYWRMRHRRASDDILFETAPDAGGTPGAWTMHAAAARRLPVTAMHVELKAGTSEAVTSAGAVRFDNLRVRR